MVPLLPAHRGGNPLLDRSAGPDPRGFGAWCCSLPPLDRSHRPNGCVPQLLRPESESKPPRKRALLLPQLQARCSHARCSINAVFALVGRNLELERISASYAEPCREGRKQMTWGPREDDDGRFCEGRTWGSVDSTKRAQLRWFAVL